MNETTRWSVADKDGNVQVPDYLDSLVNYVGNQMRFHTISGKNEIQTVVDIVFKAEQFFKDNFKAEMDKLAKEHKQYNSMLEYAGKYDISVQFWGSDCTNVFIEKGGVELTSFGGLKPADAINNTVEYLDRINRKGVKA